jgi:hypothetical protein
MDEVADRIEATIKADLIRRMGGDVSGEFAAMGVANIVIVYLNWRARFIPTVPRRVRLSRELIASAKYTEHRRVVDAITAKIEGGEDLTPHLSKDIWTVYIPAAKRRAGGRRADLDRLTAEWGIHHLHLSLDIRSNGFVTRTGDLLFGFFAADEAFLIGVFPHGSWARQEIAEIAVRNWPDAGIFTGSNGPMSLAQHYSDEDELKLRNAGVSTLREIDGRVWMSSRAGQSGAGTPIWATRDTNVLMHSIYQLRDLSDADLRARIQVGGAELGGSVPRLTTEVDGEVFRVRESVTGIVIWEASVHG